MDPLHLIPLYHEGGLHNLEPYRLYRIVHIRRICIIQMGWFLIQDTSSILNDFHHYGTFTKSEFAINQNS